MQDQAQPIQLNNENINIIAELNKINKEINNKLEIILKIMINQEKMIKINFELNKLDNRKAIIENKLEDLKEDKKINLLNLIVCFIQIIQAVTLLVFIFL